MAHVDWTRHRFQLSGTCMYYIIADGLTDCCVVWCLHVLLTCFTRWAHAQLTLSLSSSTPAAAAADDVDDVSVEGISLVMVT